MIPKLQPIRTTCTELSEAEEINHEQMLAISDFYCHGCHEYWMSENMKLVRESHGETLIWCPECGSGDLES